MCHFKGEVMANEQNLKVLSPNEARELGRIGGIMSGQSRREQKRVQEIAKAIALMPANDMLPQHKIYTDGNNKFYGLENPNISEAIIAKLACNALRGNVTAAKLFLELTGEIPKTQSVNVIACQSTGDAMQIIYGHAKRFTNNT